MKKKDNLIVLGCTGFIGRNTIEYFASINRYNVYGTYLNRKPWKNSKIKFIKADLTNKKQVKKVLRKMDIVIQAAAITTGAKDIVNKPFIHVTDNAVINSYVMKYAHESFNKFVVFLSCSIMYKSSTKPISEKELDLNTDPYPAYFGAAWMKIFIEKTCEFFSRLGRTKFLVIRHSNIYGPYDKFDLDKSHVFGATITKVLTAKKNILEVWGKGTERRDFLYVKDLVKFISIAIKKQKTKFELVNVSYGRSLSIKDLVSKIIKISEKKIKIKFNKSKPTIKTTISLSNKLVKSKFNWEPETNIDSGIKKTIIWWKKNFNKNK